MSLRRRLSILVAIGLTPPFLLMVFNTARWQIHLENDVRANAVSDARLVSNNIAQVINSGQQVMVTMSRYPVTADNETECTAYFKSVIAELPVFREAAVIDSFGRFHCSTIPIPLNLDVSDRVYFREPLATGKFTVGAYTTGRVTHSTSIHLSMPYRSPDGSLSGVIVVILNPDEIAKRLVALPRSAFDRVIVLDRNGSLVLTFPKDNNSDADSISRAVFPTLDLQRSQTTDTDVLAGRPQIIGAVPVNDEPGSLAVLVAVDRKSALAGAWYFTAQNLAIGLATMLLAIACVWIATHFLIVRPIRAVVEVARRRERGDTAAHFPALGKSTEFGLLSASLSRMSDKVDELLGQKGLLLRELQHRVMNSLNLLSSIFDMQGRQSQSTELTREQLSRARDRVIALGTVYRYLYKADAVDTIEISEFLRTICKESETAYQGPIKLAITVEAEPLMLSGTSAIALAMLTHELITNAIKHAYSEGEVGAINVSMKRAGVGGFEFRFSDRGRGMPAEFQIAKSDSLGMMMISATARQLGGTLEIKQLNPGTEFILHLPEGLQQMNVA